MQKRIGELLAERRQAMGASLADVEGATLIRSAYIEAVEKGNYNLIPGQIYVKLYVKSYASFLGMDPQQAAEVLDKEMVGYEGFSEENGVSGFEGSSLSRAQKKERIMQMRRQAARKRTLLTALVIVALTALVLIVFFLSGGKLGGGDAIPVVPPPADASPSAPPTDVVEPAEPTAAEPSGTDAVATYAHSLTMNFSDDCWIRAYADGQKVREGIFRNGDSIEIKAEQGIWVRLGNAGGAGLIYNGKDLGSPGLSRKVMDISFPSGYQPF